MLMSALGRPPPGRRYGKTRRGILRGRVVNIYHMLRKKRDLGSPLQVPIAAGTDVRFVVEPADIDITTLLRNDDPHPLSLDAGVAVLLEGLDIEDELHAGASPERVALLARGDPERPGTRLM
jgi:hypothetical protein